MYNRSLKPSYESMISKKRDAPQQYQYIHEDNEWLSGIFGADPWKGAQNDLSV